VTSRKPQVVLKFCGCCNPRVNLSKVVRHLQNIADERQNFQLLTASQGNADVLIILCGCSRACADREDVKAKGMASIVVVGELVDGEPVFESDLPSAIEKRLLTALNLVQ